MLFTSHHNKRQGNYAEKKHAEDQKEMFVAL